MVRLPHVGGDELELVDRFPLEALGQVDVEIGVELHGRVALEVVALLDGDELRALVAEGRPHLPLDLLALHDVVADTDGRCEAQLDVLELVLEGFDAGHDQEEPAAQVDVESARDGA